MKRILTSIAFLMSLVFQGNSQALNDQCESLTPCNARAICNTNTIVNPYSFTTTSTTAGYNTPCAGGSPVVTNSYSATPDWVYYRFTCYASGNFNFRLAPGDSALAAPSDLDWQLFDITTSGCGALSSANLLKCNAANASSGNFATGIQAIPTAHFESTIALTAGSTYILGISNNSVAVGQNHGGFVINFAGTTASLTDNKKPFMASIIPFDPCSPVTQIKIKLSEPVRCNQLGVGSDFNFSGTTPTYTVAATGCSGCVNAAPNVNPNYYGNATDTATITFASAMAPGTYTVSIATANSFFDLCGNQDSITKTLTFIVPAPFKDSVRTGFDCSIDKYIDTVYGVNGLSPYQYKAVGGGLPLAAGTFGASIPGYTVYTGVSGGTPVTYTVKDAGGCLVDTTILHVAVSNLGAPALNLSASPPCHDQFNLDSIKVGFISGGLAPYTFSIASTPATALTAGPATNPSPGLWKNLVFPTGATFTVTVTDALGCTNIGVRNLVNPTTMVFPTSTTTPPPCGGDSTGSICFPNATTGTPGSPPNLYTYTITPSYANTTLVTTSNNCFTNLPSGTYTLTVTDGNGCTGTSVKTLSSTPVFSINAASPKILPSCPNNCDGTFQPIPVAGLGAKKYYLYPYVGPGPWTYSDSVVSTLAPNNDFDSLCIGTYTVIARDAVGCTAITTFTLTHPVSPVLNVITNTSPLCFGGVGTIAVQTTSTTGTYASSQYTWMPSPVSGMSVATTNPPSGTLATYSGVPAGTYDLIVTNINQCADTVFGVVMTEPATPVTYSSVVVDSVTCFGTNTGKITVQATGGTAGINTYKYAIKVGAGAFSAFGAATLAPMVYNSLAAGVYTIRAKDHNNCFIDTTITIEQPTKLNLLLDHTVSTCFATSAGEICVIDTGATPGYEYKLGVAGAYSPVQPAGSVYCFTGLASGNYTVYTRDAKLCLDTLVANVASIPLPVVSFSAVPNDTVCDGTMITLCGTGADTYSWNGGAPTILDCTAFLPGLGTTTYTVTGTDLSTGCVNNAVTNVLVNPIPVLALIANQTVCNGVATAAVNFSSSVPSTTFVWSHDGGAGIGIASNGTVNIPSFTAVNNTNVPIVVTFTVTPTGPNTTNCVGADQNFTITINPTPILTDPTDQELCAGDFTAPVNFNSTVSSTTFDWISSNGSIGLLPFPAGSGDIASFQALNTGNTPATCIVTITPSANSCPGANQSFTYKVNPLPFLTDPTDQVVCNSTSTSTVTFISNVSGTSFDWTNSDPTIGLAASGSGNSIPSFTAINTSNVPVIATICITPEGPGPTDCEGNTQCFTITVNPTPIITAIPDETICAGASTTSVIFNSTVAGTTFSWTNSNPSIGLGAASVGNPSGIPSFVGINLTSVSQTGNIVVTLNANACPGVSETFSITVDPIPVITPVIGNQTVCDNEPTTAINFASNVVGATFDWVCNTSGIGLASTSGSGNIASFTAINSGTSAIVATFTVTPTGPANSFCDGTPQTFTLTILPRQNPSFTYPSSTYCQTGVDPLPVFGAGANTSGVFSATPGGLVINSSTGLIDLSASALNAYVVKYVTPGPCPDSATYNVTITLAPTAGFSYIPTSYCQSGTNPFPTFASGASAGNFTSAPPGLDIDPSTGEINLSGSFAGTYNVVNTIVAAGGCAAASAATNVTIDSTTILTTPSDQVVCNGATTSPVVFNSTVPGTTYTWAHNGTAIGIAANGSGNIPAFLASNSGSVPLAVTFTVTPTGPTPNFCPGLPKTFTLTINPTPILTDPSDQLLCADEFTLPVNFVSTVAGTTVLWTNSNTTIGIGTPGNTDIPSFQGLNSSNVPNTATFTVTPSANLCGGSSQTFVITVNPKPVLVVPANQAFCNGTNSAAIIFSSNVPSSTYSWSNSDPSIGLPSSGTGNIPVFSGVNTGTAPVVATICVTPNGPNPTNCEGITECFTITVYPTPDINVNIDQELCAGESTLAYNFNSTVTGTVFDWTNSQSGASGIGLAAAGVNDIPSFTAVNTTNAPLTGTIIVTPSANSCPGTSDTFTIKVDPVPTLNSVSNQTLCANQNTTTINFVSNVVGTTFDWTCNTAGIGVPLSGSGDITSFTAINNGTVPIIATFTVVPTGPNPVTNCLGLPITFTITINPIPDINVNIDQELCAGETVLAYNFNSGVAGTVFNWTNSQSGVTGIGLPASGSNDIPSFVAVNTTNASLAGTVIVSTTANACPGAIDTFTIKVDPVPVLNPISNQVVCGNDMTAAINFNSNVAGTTYSWNCNTSGIGIATSGTGNIAPFTAINNGTTPIVATFTVTPTGPNPITNCVGLPITFTITIQAPQTATFSYSPSTVCLTGSNPTPTFLPTTTAGGTFSYTGAGTLNLNTSTGVITLLGSTTGSYVVTYITPGPCADTATTNLVITTAPCATFSYPTATYCQSGATDPLPSFGSGCSAGAFSSTPGLSINSSTGQIDVSASVAGTYTVTNFIVAAGGCASASATTSVTIDSATVMNDPADQVVCNGQATTLVVPGGAVAGSSFSWTNSNTGIGLASSSGTGNVPSFTAVNNGNVPVSTTITYTPSGPLGCVGPQQSFTITVNPDAKISLSSGAGSNIQTKCVNTAITPITYNIGGSGNAASILWSPSTPGTVSGVYAAGVYTISGIPSAAGVYNYTVTATGICGSATATGTITVSPNATLTLTSAASTSSQVVCKGTPITAITYSVGGTGNNATVAWTPSSPGITGTYAAGVFTMSGSSNLPGIYTYTVTATGTCGSSALSGSLEITPLQDPTFFYPNPTNCQSGTTQPSPGSPVTPGGTFSATPAGLSINSATGVINLATSSIGAYLIKYVTPGPCKDSTTLPITVVTIPCADFSYANNNYCQSSTNPGPSHPFGCSNGNYSSVPAGVVFVSTSTGVIDLAGSTPGVYQIINTIAASGVCPMVADTFTITITSKPSLTLGATTPAGCNPTCNGTAATNTSGGSPAYSYAILPATAVINAAGFASGLCSGTIYTITVTDAIGCTGTLTVSIGTSPSPAISTTVNNASVVGACDGSIVALGSGGTPGYIYSILPVAAQLPAGTFINLCDTVGGINPCYTVTVIDTKGCTATVVDCIDGPAAITCSGVATGVSCFGSSDGSINGSATGGTPPYTFSGIPGVDPTTGDVSGLSAGSYTLTVTDTLGLSDDVTIIVTTPAQLVFTTPVINTPTCTPGCDGTLTISANGGTGTKSYNITSPVGMLCIATQGAAGNFANLGVGIYTILVTDANFCTATTTVQINASPLPTLSLSHTNPSCHDVCDGTIACIGGGGTGSLGYGITSPSGATCIPTQPTSGNFATLGGGVYLIVVTDSKGCNVSDTESLVNPPAIIIDTLTHTNVLCNGVCDGTIHCHGFGGTGAISYTLTPPLGPPVSNASGNFSLLCAGTYTVAAHDANCSITSTVVITQPPALIWTIANSVNISCAGTANGIINTLAGGGVAPINYSLNGGGFASISNFTGLLAGSYTVVARDANACTISSVFTIVEPPLLTLSAPVVTNLKCNGSNDGKITITASGGTPGTTGYTYNITPVVAIPNSTGVFSNLPAGTYAITVTDSAGCNKNVTGIIVSQPAPLVFTLTNHQDVACFGDATGTITVNTQGGTPAITYSLSPNVGAQGPSGFFSGLPAGTYIVTATDVNNCSSSTVVNVTQGPQIILVSFTATEPVCNGDPTGRISFTVIGGTGQLKFKLDGGPLTTDTFFNNLSAGNHLLSVVDALGCQFDQIISVKEPDPVTATVNLQDASCVDSKDGKAIVVGNGGRGGYKYYLTPGLHINKTGLFTGLAPGDYQLRVVDTSGCEYNTQITIDPPVNPLSNIITKKDLACNGVGNEGTATANVSGGNPPYTYLWNTKPVQTTANASTLYFGSYNVIVTDANGCVIRDTIYIDEGPCCDVAFIPNAFSPNGDQKNDEFRILTTAGVILTQLEIYNRWGKQVWSTIDYRGGWNGTIDGQPAPIDTYYYIFRYKCTRDNESYTKKGDLLLVR